MADMDTRIRIRSCGALLERTYMSSPLLRLLHLASPALPIGGFHFSQGLEYAVSREWVHDEASALDWIEGLATNVLGRSICRYLRGCMPLAKSWISVDAAKLERLSWLPRERQRSCAQKICTWAARWRKCSPNMSSICRAAQIERPTYATVFAFACRCMASRERRDVLSTYAWAWAENQVLAALKLVPLGQTSRSANPASTCD